MSAGGVSTAVHLGPGRVYFAPIGTAEPVSASAALPGAWIPVGYTEDGTQFETDISTEGIFVSEEIDPILFVQTARATKVTLQMAQMDVQRLALAMGAGATRANTSALFDFPDPTQIVPIMLVWDSAESATDPLNRRWVFRECYPSGTVASKRTKAPAKALLAATFNCSKPSGAASPVRIFPDATGRI